MGQPYPHCMQCPSSSSGAPGDGVGQQEWGQERILGPVCLGAAPSPALSTLWCVTKPRALLSPLKGAMQAKG